MLHHVASSQHCLTLMAPLMSSAPMAMAAAMIWPPGGGTTACITVVRTPSMARNESLKAARGPPTAPASELTWSVRFITDEGMDDGCSAQRLEGCSSGSSQWIYKSGAADTLGASELHVFQQRLPVC